MAEDRYTANCARASWVLDKLSKNYLVRCWRAREEVVDRLSVRSGRLHYEQVQIRLRSPAACAVDGPYVFMPGDVVG